MSDKDKLIDAALKWAKLYDGVMDSRDGYRWPAEIRNLLQAVDTYLGKNKPIPSACSRCKGESYIYCECLG